MKWAKIRLGDIAIVSSSKRIFARQYTNQGIPFYRQKEIIDKKNKVELSDVLYISQETYDEIKSKFGAPQKGDLLITAVGVTLGIPYVVGDEVFYFKDGNLIWLREFDDSADSTYIYYWIASDLGKKAMWSRTIGSAQPALTIDTIKQFEIPFPPIKTQRRIASVLSAYDDLIENNQKQIKLLEEAAQRLYKEWFVDLRFPGYENTKIVDGVPEGWEKTRVEAICTLSKTVLKPENIQADLAYIGLEHMPRKSICLSEWGTSSDVSSNKFRYSENDIIFGKIRPYFHKVGFSLNNGVASTDTIIMKANNEMWSLLLMTVSSVNFVDFTYKTCKEGSKMPRADWNEMKQYAVLIPNDHLLKVFNDYIWNTTRRIKALALENHSLAEARDRLLPKLMSGEIEV